MRRATNTNILFRVNLPEHYLQGNVLLRHLLNAKNLRLCLAFKEVNDWAPKTPIGLLGLLGSSNRPDDITPIFLALGKDHHAPA